MQNLLSRLLPILGIVLLALGHRDAAAERLKTLESDHFRIMHEKKHAQLAGEILQIAEGVWPTLAKAYESYEHYERIDILIIDETDDANGFAIYPWSQVAIFAPHMDWILRNRQIWLRNVVTHELAHVFTLRRAARLSPFDWVDVTGSTYNARDRINFAFSVPWVPLIAPNWYVEGIAQFEAEQNGNDNYDSQRDMLLRDAYLTGTLPSLDYIETFDRSEDWIQSERVYNTGYAFLRWLKDRYGADKVRQLAFHKPLFNFSSAAERAFGHSLADLYDTFKRSLAEKYADFKDLPLDAVADSDMPGSFQQNLVFSSDGKYMAWLGNDESRRFPANWIHWKKLKNGGVVKKAGAPVTPPSAVPDPAKQPEPTPNPEPKPDGFSARSQGQGIPGFSMFRSPNPTWGLAGQYRRLGRNDANSPSPARMVERNHKVERSEELGSEGLEFNRENNRLLTTRQDYEYSRFTDIWEYEFLGDKDEDERWHRLTWEERASYPSYHPSGRKIVFVRKKAGSTNLAVLDSTGRVSQLTNFSGGQQVYNPRYSPGGDSIYFTFQVEDKEAIAAIAADAPAFDPFAALLDSAQFPDSTNFARNQKLVLVTPLRQGGIRNIRFAGDTLVWSSNMDSRGLSVYNVYARLPGDSSIQRATNARTQALEPLIHGGDLYYQGFHRQKFLIFKRPLVFSPAGPVPAPAVDSVSFAKPKKIDYSKAFATDEYSSRRIAHEIVPFLQVQPQFLENNRTYTDVALGLSLNIGDPLGNWTQSFAAAVAKRANLQTPLNYKLSYAGGISGTPIRHTRTTWPMSLQYSLYHDIINDEYNDPVQGFYFQGSDSVNVAGSASLTSTLKRDMVNAYVPLPYNFLLDARFFRQRISQNLTRRLAFTNGTTGVVTQQTDMNIPILVDAPHHRNFNSGLSWGYTKMKLGTFLPTGIGVWGSGRKWWATYMSDYIYSDSLLIRAASLRGEPAPSIVFTQSEFSPWSLDAGLGAVWSYRKAFSLFGNLEAGTFLNKFPTEEGRIDVVDNAPVIGEEPAGTLWVMNYQLGYYLMPGYPYNFRYRGRDLMEGTSFGLASYGLRVPIRGLGAFIPALPTSSFRQFELAFFGNAGATFVNPADKIYSFIEAGQHQLLLDFSLRASANFRIYHQFPFTIYAQGSMPYNHLRAANLFWYDYAHTGAANQDGSPSAVQLANAAADRERHIQLVKEPRYYVGFQLGY